jgi:hypothetical protein
MAERAKSSTSKKRKPKAKANGAGHNSSAGLPDGGPPDEVYQRWLSKIETAENAYDRAAENSKKRKSELGNIYTGAKDDGCDIDAIKRARKEAKRAAADVAAEFANIGRVLRIMKSPLQLELGLFSQPDWPEPVSANLHGYRVGKAGGSIDECPHIPGTESFAAWMTGHEGGQAENRESLRNAQ